MSDDNFTTSTSGGCLSCSWRDRITVHGTPWCPEHPATAIVDTNDPCRHSLSLSRPVELGEYLTGMYGRDHPFACWGRITETVNRDDGMGQFVSIEEVDGAVWTYVSEHPPAESSAAQALREREDLEGAARALVVAVRMHNAMCRAVGITRAHGPDRWPEERRLSDLLGMDPPTASLPTEERA